MSKPEVQPAEAALRFLGMFGETQVTMRHVFDRYLEFLSPAVGAFISKRLGRMSDSERFDALLSLAGDHGERERARAVVEVSRELKKLRDILGHATVIGSDRDVVFALVSMESHEFSVDQLLRAYGRAQWVVESTLYIGHAAGVMAHDGGPYNRFSGTTILEDPPSLTPPSGPLPDPVVLLERVDEGDL